MLVDFHQHIIPDGYRAFLASLGKSDAGGRELPAWSEHLATEFMEQRRIERALLSLSAPGVSMPGAGGGASLARDINLECDELARRRPERFGFLGTLPLPDVDAAVGEIHFLFERTRAEGIILLSNYEGIYLGDARFAPVLEALDSHRALVLVHPNELPFGAQSGLPFPGWIADFLLDTTRAAVNLVAQGATRDYPNISFVLSHAGAFIPYIAGRIATGAYAFPRPASAKETIEQLRSFYFDTALSSTKYALPSLLSFAREDRIVFGSDWPFAQGRTVDHFMTEAVRYGDGTLLATTERNGCLLLESVRDESGRAQA